MIQLADDTHPSYPPGLRIALAISIISCTVILSTLMPDGAPKITFFVYCGKDVVTCTCLDHFSDHLQGLQHHVSFSRASHWRGEARHRWGVRRDQDLIIEMDRVIN